MAAYTHGTLGESVKYLMQGAQISGEEVLSGDAMPEIPPFEATASLQWPLNGGNLVPKASVRMVAAQKHLSAHMERMKHLVSLFPTSRSIIASMSC
jgi:hypothetical protein